MVLRRVLVSGPITALAAASPRWKVTALAVDARRVRNLGEGVELVQGLNLNKYYHSLKTNGWLAIS